MQKNRFALVGIAMVATLVTTSDLCALANRVYASARSGNDANSCDNILTPCQTFAGAVTQLNAGGELIVLDSGGYGPVTITKSLTIEASAGVTAFIHPPTGDAITISATSSSRVVLRGLTLNVGTAVGIRVNTVGSLLIENCVISGFSSQGLLFNAAGVLEMRDTIVRYSGDAAVIIQPSGATHFLIDRCRFSANFLGVYVYDGSQGTASSSVFADQTGGAVGAAQFAGGPSEFNLENCVVSNNSVGIVSNGAMVRVSNSTLTDNQNDLNTFNGGSVVSRSNNTVRGNTTTNGFTGNFVAD